MKIRFTTALFLTCLCLGVQAQDAYMDEPKGKAIIQVFGNFHSGFGINKDDRGFELDRSYLGYEYKFTNGLSVKGVMDIGKPSDIDDYHRIAYIKNALISWKKEKFTLNGGLISTTQFNFQEKFWGYRYVMKSFQDQYKFGSSADVGLSASYEFAKWFSSDLIIVNGEGYKKIQKNDGLNYGLGVTLTPVKGFQIRLYGGYNENGENGESEQTDIVNLASFMGYKSEKFTFGTEFNYINNAGYEKNAVLYGYSIFAASNFSERAGVFLRFDDIYSKDNWNIAKDESAAIIGSQIKLGKYVKIAPNFRVNIPKEKGSDIGYYGYINCYFGI